MTAYEMRISDWSSDVCSTDLDPPVADQHGRAFYRLSSIAGRDPAAGDRDRLRHCRHREQRQQCGDRPLHFTSPHPARSEEHTSELQSLMRISYAVFCLKKKTIVRS